MSERAKHPSFDKLSPAQRWHVERQIERSRAQLAAGERTYSLDEVMAYRDACPPLLREVFNRLNAAASDERRAYTAAHMAGDDEAANRHDWRWCGIKDAIGALAGLRDEES